jgi:phthalate 4,5-dioxygenase oxygenase subunit
MLTQAENDLLTRVEGDAPMGQMLRRYWLPALQSAELDVVGAPKRLRLLGERLVAFRDSRGSVGVLDENCPHRGASLALALNAECGLRCLYHGWKVDVTGRVLDTPTEPEDSTYRDRIRHTAYEVREAGGMVWVYLGPPGTARTFPSFEWMSLPDERRLMIKVRQDCNWVQALEGVIDSAHLNYLHADYSRTTLTAITGDGRPRLEIENTDYGFRYAAIRRSVDDPEQQRHIRISLFVAPFFGFTPMLHGQGYMQAFVPADDTHTTFNFVVYRIDRDFTQADRDEILTRYGVMPGLHLDGDFVKVRREENNWLQDRGAMRRGESFSGFSSQTTMEDMAVQESMGPIIDRTREHIGVSDLAVIRMRRIMLDSVRRFQAGGQPVGLEKEIDYSTVRAIQVVLPAGELWTDEPVLANERVD